MRTVIKPMFLVAAAAAALCACGRDKPAPPPASQGESQPASVIAAPAVQALEKAKTVDATVQQQKADVDAAVDAQGQ